MSSAVLQATRLQPQGNAIGVDSVLLGVFVTLLMLGLVMVFSSTILGESNPANQYWPFMAPAYSYGLGRHVDYVGGDHSYLGMGTT